MANPNHDELGRFAEGSGSGVGGKSIFVQKAGKKELYPVMKKRLAQEQHERTFSKKPKNTALKAAKQVIAADSIVAKG